MKNWASKFLMIVLAVGSLSGQAQASNLDSFRELFARNDFELEEDTFRGNFRDAKYWSGRFCHSYWKYQVNLWGGVEDIRFDMNEDGSVNVEGNLEDIHGYFRGNYRGGWSACLAVAQSIGLSASWAKLKGRVWFIENENGDIKVKVKVRSTEIGKLEFYGWFPDWVENLATKGVNKALSHVWKSELGDWLSKKLSKFIQEKVPEDQLPI